MSRPVYRVEKILFGLVLCLLSAVAQLGWADCTSPAGIVGTVAYASNYNTMVYTIVLWSEAQVLFIM